MIVLRPDHPRAIDAHIDYFGERRPQPSRPSAPGPRRDGVRVGTAA